MLRTDKVYPKKQNESYWTIRHFAWLKETKYEDSWMQEAFETYLTTVTSLMAEVRLMDEKIARMAGNKLIKEKVNRLICIPGIDIMTAVSIVVEIFEITRFQTARSFAHFLGLCPGEESSGQKEKRGPITKAGNGVVRKLLTESSQSIKKTGIVKSKRIIQRQEGASLSGGGLCGQGRQAHTDKDAVHGKARREIKRRDNGRSQGTGLLRLGNADRQYRLKK